MCVITFLRLTATNKELCKSPKEPPQVSNILTSSQHVERANQTTELERKEASLIDIVQSLGEYINDEDAVIRSKAVNFLSQVIGALQPSFLTRQQIQVLCQFLCDRIEDGGAVGGLTKLQELQRFNKEMAIMTLRA
jgi:DNA repair/transcription protein MET18/MMS19